MLIVLLLFTLFHLLHGVPLFPGSESLTGIDASPLAPRHSTDKFGQRGINDIVVSCLVTIFACTWTAVHPNIPSPTDSDWMGLKRRMIIMMYAFLAPEATTGWALNQYLGAKRIVAEYNSMIAKVDPPKKTLRETMKEWFNGPPLPAPVERNNGVKPWTMRHAFFIQMGGFMLSENGKPIQTLVWPNLYYPEDINICQYISNGLIDAPTISEAEIQDRSKGDFISKGVVVLQTLWFVIQCFARWAEKLPVTELEVVTLAFAALNGITYALWWNKPQGVGLPVYLEKKPQRENIVISVHGGMETEPDFEVAEPQLDPAPSSIANGETGPEPAQADATSESIPRSWFQSRVRKDRKHHHWLLWIIWRIPYRVFQTALRSLGKLISLISQKLKEGESGRVMEGDLRVPIFYATTYSIDVLRLGAIASGAISAFFGFIYLLPGWFLEFPSRAEMQLWRGCAFVITVQPILMTGSMLNLPAIRGKTSAPFLTLIFTVLSIFIGMPLYIIARFILLILAIISLRALPTGALQTVNWTSFIPHL